MLLTQKKNKLFAVMLASFLVLLDQGVKFFVLNHYAELVSKNSGGAFSIGYGLTWYKIFSLVLVILISAVFFFSKDKKIQLPLAFVCAGAVSNQFDRIFRNGVVDFIDFKIWPSFNLADSFIFIGVCLIAYSLIREGREGVQST